MLSALQAEIQVRPGVDQRDEGGEQHLQDRQDLHLHPHALRSDRQPENLRCLQLESGEGERGEVQHHQTSRLHAQQGGGRLCNILE